MLLFDSDKFFLSLESPPKSRAILAVSNTLSAFEKIYAAGLDAYLLLEKLGFRTRFKVPIPVISIGNLSVGGTGKTPATIEIALRLQRMGFKVAILSRGYGGTKSHSAAVVSNERGEILLDVGQSGDEPMALAKSLPGIPVLVGKDRRVTAALASKSFNPDILLLDDGFQYWQLARDVDIVLLDASRPFDNGHCLPRGLLREPKRNLVRAQIVLVTRSAGLSENRKQFLRGEILSVAPRTFIYFASHLSGEIVAKNEKARDLGATKRPFAVSAVGRPDSFFATLAESNIEPVDVLSYGDHHKYTNADVRKIVGKMTKVGADAIITTDKDSVKLEKLLTEVPIFSQEIKFQVSEMSDFLSKVLVCAGLPNRSFAEMAH